LDKVLGSTIPDLLQPVNQSLIDIHMGINFGNSDSTSGLQPSIAPEQLALLQAQIPILDGLATQLNNLVAAIQAHAADALATDSKPGEIGRAAEAADSSGGWLGLFSTEVAGASGGQDILASSGLFGWVPDGENQGDTYADDKLPPYPLPPPGDTWVVNGIVFKRIKDYEGGNGEYVAESTAPGYGTVSKDGAVIVGYNSGDTSLSGAIVQGVTYSYEDGKWINHDGTADIVPQGISDAEAGQENTQGEIGKIAEGIFHGIDIAVQGAANAAEDAG
jgi:hypothetical protein